mmetsp:Transcript_85099/g.246085  ORF Transcript_85099/g.246085 Transcript_85099/m.246085 type:complete len:108 (+) Transcript_85099:330-653(+)
MPDFLEIRILKPRLDLLKDTMGIIQIVNPQRRPRPISQTIVKVWPRVNTDACYITIADRTYFLEIDIHNFGITGMKDTLCWRIHEDLHNFSGLFSRLDNSNSGDSNL